MSGHARFEVAVVERSHVIIRDVGPHDQFKTVTNDIENVIERLCVGELLPPGRRLFYFDSEGDFAEVKLTVDVRFAGFAAVRDESLDPV